MAAIQELVGQIRIDSSGVVSGTAQAKNELSGLEGTAHSVGSSMQSAGKKMTMGVTAPLVAMGATAVQQAATFESAMQQSIAIMGDVSEAERRDLEQTAREVAKSTTMSHEQAAESYYYLASAGMDAAQSMEAMPVVAEYAEAAQLDMATATDYATDIMSAFGYEASELTTVTDTLTAAVSNHNTTAEGMGEAMSYVAPVANSLGISIQETSAAIGMFSDVGIKGSKAGTALRGVLASLADPTAKQASLLKELGVKTHDAQGNMVPLVDIVRQLENAGADTADIMGLFGREAGPAMAALLAEGSDALEENTQALMDAEGATKSVAETQRDTLMGSLQILKSNLADVAITFGTEFIPFIRMAADAASALATGFGTIPSPMRKVIIVAAALAAALGPILFIAGTMLTMVPSLVAGWGVLSGALAAAGVSAGSLGVVLAALTGPIGILIGAVALLAAAWASDFGGIRGHTMRVVGVLREELSPAIDWLRGVASRLFSLFGGEGSGSFAALSAAAEPLVAALADGLIWAIRGTAQAARILFSVMSTVWTALAPIVTGAVNAIVTYLDILYVTGRGLFQVARSVWAGDWEAAWLGIFNIFADIAGRISGFLSQWFPGLGNQTAAHLIGLRNRWILFGQNLRTTVLNTFTAVKTAFTNALAALNAIFGPSIGQLLRVWSVFSQQVRAEASLTWAAVRAKIAPFINWLRAFVPPVLVAIQAKWTQFSAIVRSAATLMASGVRSVVTALMSYIRGRFFATLSAISGFWSVWGSDITAVARQTGATIKTVIVGWMDLVKSAIIIGLRLIRGDWSGAWAAIVGITGRTTGRIKSIIAGWASVLSGIVKTLVGRIIGFFQNLYRRLVGGSIVPNMANAIVRVFTNLKARVIAAVTNLKNQSIRAFTTLKNRVVSAANTLRAQTVGKILALKNRGVREINALKAQAIRSFNTLKNRVVAAANRLRAQAISKFNALKSRAMSIVRTMMSALPRIIRRSGGAFKRAGGVLISSFARGIAGKIGRVKTSVKNAVAAARRYLPKSDAEEGPLSDLSQTGPALVETFAAGIESNIDRVRTAAQTVARAARRPFESGGGLGRSMAAILDQYEEFSPEAAREALAQLTPGELDELAVSIGETGWVDGFSEASALLDEFMSGGFDQSLFESLYRSEEARVGGVFEQLRGLVDQSTGSLLGGDVEVAIKGTDRMDNLKAIRSGRITIDDLQSATSFTDERSTAETLAGAMTRDLQRAGLSGEVTPEDLIAEARRAMKRLSDDSSAIIDDILGRGSYTAEELRTLANIARETGKDFKLTAADFRDPVYYVGNELGKMGRLIEWANNQTEAFYGGRYDHIRKKTEELGSAMGRATEKFANFESVVDAAVERRGEFDAAALTDILSEFGEADLFRLADEMKEAASIKTSEGSRERGTFLMKNPFKDAKATFRQLKAAAADSSKISQALYDSLSRGDQFGFRDEMEDIFDRAIEARRQGMVQAEDGSWVDPSFYGGRPTQRRTQESAYSLGGGSAAQPRETGDQIAQAVRDVLAGSKLEVDVEDEELVDRATLRIEEQRRQNVRSSVRSTR